MPGAEPLDREGLHGGAEPAQRFDVFDAQRVVRLGKEGGDPAAQLGRRLLPCLGKGDSPFEMIREQLGKAGIREGIGCRFEGGHIAAFAAEAQHLHAAQRIEQRYRAEGESFRRGQRPRRRQLQHQIRPAREGSPGPVRLGQQGGFPPLDKVAAHDGDDMGRAAPAVRGAGALDMMGMAVVKGVVFRDDAGNLQKNPALLLKNV